MSLADRRQRPFELGGERRVVGLDQRLGVAQRLADGGRSFSAGRDAGECVLVGARRAAHIARLLEVSALLQECAEVAWLELQRLLEGVHLLGAPPQRLETARQVGPQRRVPGVRIRRPHEQRVRLLRRSTAEHEHPELVEHAGMIRSLVRQAHQQLLGFRGSPGRGFRPGRLQDPRDGRVVQRCR